MSKVLPIFSSSSPLLDALELHRVKLVEFLQVRCRGWAEESEVEDALQELWLRVAQVDSDSVGDPKAYLYRAAHNMMLDRARRRAARERYEKDWTFVQNSHAQESSAERTLLARERLSAVNLSLERVGARAARIFRRYRIDGIEQKQIAAELDISLSTVEKDLRKSYAALLSMQENQDEP